MGELYRNCDLDTVVNFLAKQVYFIEIQNLHVHCEPQLILNPSECVEADRDESKGDEGGVDATVRHHTRLLQVGLLSGLWCLLMTGGVMTLANEYQREP